MSSVKVSVLLSRVLSSQALNAAKEEVSRLQAQEQAKLKELMDQKKELEKQLASVRETD